MTDLEHDPNEQNNSGAQSRARLRKLKKDRAVTASPDELETPRRKSARRLASRIGPSVRERLAATHINLPTEKIQSLQGKISSTVGQVVQQLTEDPTSQDGYEDKFSAHSSRRRSDTRRSDNYFQATSRAETQRRSGGDQVFSPRKNRRVYDARSEAAPPVMVRGGMGGMAFGRVASSRLNKQRSPRRRMDVPLSIPGAEVRLPSIPLVNLGWRGISLIMVVMLSICLLLMWKAPIFQVNSVDAIGLQRLTAADVNAVIGTFGKSVFSLNPSVLKQNLQQAFPEFSKISVSLNLPARLKVVVVERQPVLSWTQDGREAWVDAEGVSFPPRGTPSSPLVTVEGYGTPPTDAAVTAASGPQYLPPGMPFAASSVIPTFRLSSDLVSAILALSAKMPADTVLVYDSEHGLGWNDPNGWEVFFGDEDQEMDMKLLVYQALVEHLQSEGIQPAMISVEYVHAPYYRMER